MMTITSYSGDFGNVAFSGIFARGSDNAPTEAWDIVASSDISKLIIYYTDGHNVDEDLRAIPIQGGRWHEEDQAGVTCRNLCDAPTSSWGHVASSTVEILILYG